MQLFTTVYYIFYTQEIVIVWSVVWSCGSNFCSLVYKINKLIAKWKSSQ